MSTPDIIGFAGVSLLLLAFFCNLIGKLKRNQWLYAALNMIGAGVAAYASWMIDYLPFVILEGTWCIVSFVALVQIMRHSRIPGNA